MVKPSAPLDPELLRPSGAILATQIALGAAIRRDAVAGTGVDHTILDLLVRLELAPGQRLRAVDLCQQLQMSPSHISRMLDRAEGAGFVERSSDPGDRRAKTVEITKMGGDVVADFAPRLHAVLRQTIHDILDPDEIDLLVSYLNRIETAAHTRTTDQS